MNRMTDNNAADRGDSTETARRFDVFIEALSGGISEPLCSLEREALEEGVPIVRPRTRGLLQFLIALCRPEEILEIGTATGFSAILMQLCAREEGIREGDGSRITTIERDPVRARKARDNFRRAGCEDITLLEGDAADLLGTLEGPYGLIFLDAAKGQYLRFLPELKRLLAPGGVLISDNVLRDGEILESRFAVSRRNRTIHHRMRAYLRGLMEDEDLRTTILENGDGVAVSVLRNAAEGMRNA